MNRIIVYFSAICLLITGFLLAGCRERPCPSSSKAVYQADFTEHQLKWIKVSDTAPLFKLTSKDESGNLVIDTLQGEYFSTIKNESRLGAGECYPVYYQRAISSLSLISSNNANYGAGLELSNDVGETGSDTNFIGSIERRNANFNENTPLDTAYINGKLYHNVYKLPESASSFRYYYARGIGFIYIKYTKQTIELLP